MDISLPFDQSQCSYSFACSLVKPTNFKLDEHFSHRSKQVQQYRFQFSQLRCSLVNQGLKPRPVPKPLKLEQSIIKRDNESKLEDTQLENSCFTSGVCGQIEKLVMCKKYNEALDLFEILECDRRYDFADGTYDALVNACIGLKSIRGVKRVFNHMVNSGFDLDLYMMNRVLLMHVKCGMMVDARQLFEEMPERNFVSWNILVGGLVDSGDFLDAFRLFFVMRNDEFDVGCRTLTMMIRASAGLELISPGQQLHSCALKMGFTCDVFVSCSLVDMYSKCGNIEDARFIFEKMPEKTPVAWNSIIAGYALRGYSEEALSLYYKMQYSGVKMDHFTYSIVVRVCTRLASLVHAKQAHAGLVRNGFGFDIVANTALVDFYSKWGKIEDSRNVFDRMPQKNVISWNALISGYGNHGRGSEAVELFERMVKSKGMVPNHITFLAVLSACCYSGLFKHGWEIFQSMNRDYKVKPRAMHYTCMVELLGREGLLDEALALIKDAPCKPTANMWAALLTACRVHKSLVLAKFAAEKIYYMEPEKLSNYVVLLNIYNSSGKLDEAAAVLNTLRRKGLKMVPSCTWIEIKKDTIGFFNGDKSHIETKEIYKHLEDIMLQISKHGYVVEGASFLPDVDECEESMLLHHSEKLAIAFGLMSTPCSNPLQLVQSHRICIDCHNSIKYISMVYNREIVIRDASRFHRFKDGSCSCGDYW